MPPKPPKLPTYVLTKKELQDLVTNYAARRLGIEPPFVHKVRIHGHWTISDLEEGVLTVTIEQAPENVVPLRARRRPRKIPRL